MRWVKNDRYENRSERFTGPQDWAFCGLGHHLRREDRREYSLEVLEAFIAEYTSHKHGIRFYNRGIPDGYGWEGFFGLKPTPQVEEATRRYRYDAIFVLDPLDTFEDPDDILRPRVLATRPSRIELVVGTQINGAPHLGANLVQTAAFLLAKIARREFSIDTVVRFGALDNAPYEVVFDPEIHTAYQQTYYHALGKAKIDELIEGYYQAFFTSLTEATDTDYAVETYTDQQATPGFRAEFLRTLERLEDIRWWMAPSHGVVHIRLPCPTCG